MRAWSGSAVKRIIVLGKASRQTEPLVQAIVRSATLREKVEFVLSDRGVLTTEVRQGIAACVYRGAVRVYLEVLRRWFRSSVVVLIGLPGPLTLLALRLLPGFSKRVVWAPVGVDVHPQATGCVYGSLRNGYRRLMLRPVRSVMTFLPDDFMTARSRFCPKAKWINAIPFPAILSAVDVEYEHGNSQPPFRVVVGNSARSINRHQECLDILGRINSRDKIEIVLPLGYSDGLDRENAVKVKQHAEAYYNGSVRYIDEFLPRDQYFALLGQCSISVFGARRQQSVGTIVPLLMLGHRVFVHERNGVVKLCESLGVSIFLLSEMSEETLKPLPENVQASNREKLMGYFCWERFYQQWGELAADGSAERVRS